MIRKLQLASVLPACIALQFAALWSGVRVYGKPISGDIRGITRASSGAPLAEVQITARSLDENIARTVVSDGDGAFLVENLQPGRYQLAAWKKGFAISLATPVQLEAQQSLHVDVILARLEGSEGANDLTSPTPPSQNSDSPALTAREKQLLDRIDRLEQRLAAMEAREAKGAAPTATPSQALLAIADVGTIQTGPVTQVASSSARASNQTTSSVQAIAPLPDKGFTQIGIPTQVAVVSPEKVTTQTGAPAKPVLPVSNDVAEGWKSPDPASAAQAVAGQKKPKIEPFSDADWTWLNGNPRTKDIYWDTKFFTPEIRFDVTSTYDNQHPEDHSMGGSSELFRSGEVQLEQLGLGGDFHWENVRGRFMTQFGAYSTATIRNDGSYTHGEWSVADANRYIAEGYGGYHFNVWNGINVDAGIFMSYIGLFSYYNFDNWAYQPSYVSSNTPWFFQGVRIQIFPTAHLKIEPWYINGWQSYVSANNRPGLGGQLKWTPFPWLNIISNNYGQGRDDLYTPNRARIHTDNSEEIKYYERPSSNYISKMAVTGTEDLGCEYGGGVSCTGDHKGGPKQSFVGAMVYNRFWFRKDLYALTIGGGEINNPGRYLVLIPPINGETAGSAAINSPYFTQNPGDKFKAWDTSLTFDWMPKQYITFRAEADWRHANVPYWSGHGGITPPAWSNVSVTAVNGNGYPTQYACNSGAPSGFTDLPDSVTACASQGGVWFPSLVKSEFLMDFDIMVKF